VVYCYTQSSVVSLSVCLLDTLVNHTKMTKQIEKPLEVLTCVGPRNCAVAYPHGGQGDVSPDFRPGDSHAKVPPLFDTTMQ